jgi:hypothetical protein
MNFGFPPLPVFGFRTFCFLACVLPASFSSSIQRLQDLSSGKTVKILTKFTIILGTVFFLSRFGGLWGLNADVCFDV